jgi:cation diffusion facilitator family transporter
MNEDKNLLRKKINQQEGWISIVVNVLLFVLKYWAGLVSGSLALIADAWHTLSDSISSIFVLISAKISFKKPDKEHPFGHGRFELVTSIFIGVLLVVIGLGFIKEGYTKFIEKGEANYGWVAIIVTLISVILKEALTQYAMWGYRKTGSNTLKADGWHHRSDAISSVVILAGIFVGRYIWWIDSALSVIVAIFIIYTAYQIISNSISVILGEKVDAELINQIDQISKEVAMRDVNAHHLHVHNYVTHKEMTFHICLPPSYSIEKGHQITLSIENRIREELNIEATIHIDPQGKVRH